MTIAKRLGEWVPLRTGPGVAISQLGDQFAKLQGHVKRVATFDGARDEGRFVI